MTKPYEKHLLAFVKDKQHDLISVHFDLGGDWMGMAHGYAWGVYSEQTGPRGDAMAFVQSMAMVMAEKYFEGGRVQLKAMVSADPLSGDRGAQLL